VAFLWQTRRQAAATAWLASPVAGLTTARAPWTIVLCRVGGNDGGAHRTALTKNRSFTRTYATGDGRAAFGCFVFWRNISKLLVDGCLPLW